MIKKICVFKNSTVLLSVLSCPCSVFSLISSNKLIFNNVGYFKINSTNDA